MKTIPSFDVAPYDLLRIEKTSLAEGLVKKAFGAVYPAKWYANLVSSDPRQLTWDTPRDIVKRHVEDLVKLERLQFDSLILLTRNERQLSVKASVKLRVLH